MNKLFDEIISLFFFFQIMNCREKDYDEHEKSFISDVMFLLINVLVLF